MTKEGFQGVVAVHRFVSKQFLFNWVQWKAPKMKTLMQNQTNNITQMIAIPKPTSCKDYNKKLILNFRQFDINMNQMKK